MAGKKYVGYGRGSQFAKQAAAKSVQQMKQGVTVKATMKKEGKVVGTKYYGIGGKYEAKPSSGGKARVEAAPQPEQEELQKQFETKKLTDEAKKQGITLKEQLLKNVPEQTLKGRSEQEKDFLATREYQRRTGGNISGSGIKEASITLAENERKLAQQLSPASQQMELKTTSVPAQTKSAIQPNESVKVTSTRTPVDQSLKGTVFYSGNKPLGVGMTVGEIEEYNQAQKPKVDTYASTRTKYGFSKDSFDWGAYLPKRQLSSQIGEVKKVKTKYTESYKEGGISEAAKTAGTDIGGSLKAGVKPYLWAHGGEVIAPLLGTLYKGARLAKAAVAEKLLPTPVIEKAVSKLPSALKNIPLGKTRTTGSVLTKTLTFGRNLILDVAGAKVTTYGVREAGTALTSYTPEEQTVREQENYKLIQQKAKSEISKDQGWVKNTITEVPFGVYLSKETPVVGDIFGKYLPNYKEDYNKQLELAGNEYGLSEKEIKSLKTASIKDLKVEQISYGAGIGYAGTSSELRGTKYVSEKTIKQSLPFIKRWIQFGKPIAKAGVGEGIGSVVAYDTSQGNKQDWTSYKPYLRYGVAGGTGYLSAGTIGGFIPAAKSSTSWAVRQAGRGVNFIANILDPSEKPTDIVAHGLVEPLKKRAGYSVAVPTIVMDVSGTKPSIFTDFNNLVKPSTPANNVISNVNQNKNQNVNQPVQPQKPKTPTKPKTVVPIKPIVFGSNVNVPVTTTTDVPVQPKVDIPVQPKTDIPVQPKTDIPVQPKTDIPVQPKEDVPVQPRSDVPVAENVPVSVIGGGGIGWGLMLPFGQGGKGEKTGKRKREYGYTAGFAARLLGITAEKAPEPSGGFFTGQEIRPIITGKKPKITKKATKRMPNNEMYDPFGLATGKTTKTKKAKAVPKKKKSKKSKKKATKKKTPMQRMYNPF